MLLLNLLLLSLLTQLGLEASNILLETTHLVLRIQNLFPQLTLLLKGLLRLFDRCLRFIILNFLPRFVFLLEGASRLRLKLLNVRLERSDDFLDAGLLTFSLLAHIAG